MQQIPAMDLLALTVVQSIVTVLFVVVCILLILVVLLQKGRGGGLAGAFGGAGGHSAFGAKTGDVFTWFTVGLTCVFILVAIIGNFLFVPPDVTASPGVGVPVGAPPGSAVPPDPGAPANPVAPPVRPVSATQPGG